MTANQLMIGDWVLQCELNVPVKVQSIMCHYADEDVYFYHEASEYISGVYKLEPIPLTKEILEKNSFLEVEAIEYPSHSVGISFLYRNTSEGLRIFVQNACTGGPTCTMIKTCKYVHEVQHMIKMCDIEKEIVL